MILTAAMITALSECSPATPFGLRTDENGMIRISSGDPDPGATLIRNSDLTLVAKVRALDALRESRLCSPAPTEDVGTSSDGGVVIDLSGPSGRELMIAVPASGSWTYFSAAIEGRQVKGGILRDDGIRTPIRWVAGLQEDLDGPGVIVG